ncbi:hypothetical protein [Streptomyces sp. NBC_00459]|uniref:hypothetical protein n=1 Tax=Streptomyces sp. NBC_00459 TaxID=2975749 RepID=UPI002E16EAD1
MSRSAWRRAVLVWVLAVAVGGGLTVWLRDSAEPSATHGRYGTGEDDPAPLLRQDVKDLCSATPGASPTPEETSRVIVVCASASVR